MAFICQDKESVTAKQSWILNTHLFQGCISQLENIHNGHETSVSFNNRKVKVMAIYSSNISTKNRSQVQ